MQLVPFVDKYISFIDKKPGLTTTCPGGQSLLATARRKGSYRVVGRGNSVACSGLVAHGCCNETFISHPKFSNSSNSGCSSLGKYKVGSFYTGKYGASYRLYGLDNSNSNA